MRINLPQGSRAALIDGWSDYPEEREILIARNSRLRFDGKTGPHYNFTLLPHEA
jgi:hypothetical protein